MASARPSAKDLETPYTHVCSCVSLDEGAVEDGAALGRAAPSLPAVIYSTISCVYRRRCLSVCKALSSVCAFDSSHRR